MCVHTSSRPRAAAAHGPWLVPSPHLKTRARGPQPPSLLTPATILCALVVHTESCLVRQSLRGHSSALNKLGWSQSCLETPVPQKHDSNFSCSAALTEEVHRAQTSQLVPSHRSPHRWPSRSPGLLAKPVTDRSLHPVTPASGLSTDSKECSCIASLPPSDSPTGCFTKMDHKRSVPFYIKILFYKMCQKS